MRVTRRSVVAGLVSAGAASSVWGGPRNASGTQAGTQARPAAGSHVLPARICGFNTPVMWDIAFEDPAMRPVLAGTRPALLRFPGGTVANFWNWRAGRVEVAPGMMGNFAFGARNAPDLHPMGESYEDFAQFARAVGSELVLVLNLETASLEDQMQWLRHLVEVGVPPTRIEMGNEFYLESAFAKLAGRTSAISSQKAALALSEKYASAARRIVKDAQIAVQSAGSAFDAAPGAPRSAYHELLAEWDAELVSAPWYDAVTWHIYPEISTIMGSPGEYPFVNGLRVAMPDRYRSAAYLDAADAELAFNAMLARVESGTRRQAELLARRVPGKEIWVTEWGVGENLAYYRGERPRVTALWVHVLARQLLCLLREPSVTMALNHSIYLDGLAWSCFRRDESEAGYKPIGAYDVFAWIYDAANAGTQGDSVTVAAVPLEDAKLIAGGAAAKESYTDLVALEFAGGGRRVLIVHNTRRADAAMSLRQTALGEVRFAQALSTPSLIDSYSTRTPAVRSLNISDGTLIAPARSLARVVAQA